MFGGSTVAGDAGGTLLIDFEPFLSGPFVLDANGSGFVTVAVNQDAGPLAFTFVGATDRGAISGTVASVSTVPEPGTVLLVATGLGLVGLVARRRAA